MPAPRASRAFLSFLFVWMLAWIVLSWAAVQDDAFIHLRYAHNLRAHLAITYDGTHSNYGASSLLYVGILALLERVVTGSSELPRGLSSLAHVLLFGGLALAFGASLPRSARTARLAALLLSALLAMPSAIRWLDDGMETVWVISFAASLAWLIHRHRLHKHPGERFGFAQDWRSHDVLLVLVSFLAVLLRTELLLLCAVGACLLALPSDGKGVSAKIFGRTPNRRRFAAATPTLFGAAAAVGVVIATMHVLLPDTALAKSHGISHWSNPIHDTAVTLGGAFSFGLGMMLFWLLTLALVLLRSGGLSLRTVLANCLCPVVLALSALRGQEIQGVRYFAWIFMFSIVWNILELGDAPEERSSSGHREVALLCIFAGLLAIDLPFESVAMWRVLTHRSTTIRTFEAQHLEVLRERRGMASDIGYIGYFSHADICDLAGLVNGRAAARMTRLERAQACARTAPDFVFLNAGQLRPMARMMDLSQWQICGRYDFTNVSTPDTHYLLVRPGITDEVCRATSMSPVPIETILPGSSNASLH